MDPEGSLPHSQESSTCPYPKPDQFSPRPIPSLENHFNIIRPYMPRSYMCCLSPGFRYRNPVCKFPLLHTSYMQRHLILLDLMNRIMFVDKDSQ